MFTREEFEAELTKGALEMRDDKQLQQSALNVLVQADKYRWVHQSKWLGEPCIQLTQDLFAIQEIIYKTKPDFIIEVGVAWGGSVLFYATIFEAMGAGKIIGVDIYIPEDLKQRINSHGKISERINLIEASSLEVSTVNKIKELTGNSKKLLIHLDSNHTHEHVLKELELYSELVGDGYYLICGDTIVESIPEQTHRPRPWGIGNNPMTALNEFLKKNDKFETDAYFDNKLLFSCNPRGYLKRIKL
jgi:cephalosporin hydroxylase